MSYQDKGPPTQQHLQQPQWPAARYDQSNPTQGYPQPHHQPLLPPHGPAQTYYHQPQVPGQPPRAPGTAGRAATHAAGYGGSEVGSMVGHMVGPPIIGGIIGNIVGDKLGQKAVGKTGLDRAAGQFHEDLSKVVGKERADKVGEIAGTALGFAESERCLCCPCMPASQILFFLMVPFFVFNWYRLIVGIRFESSCSENGETHIMNVPYYDNQGDLTEVNQTEIDEYWLIKNDSIHNVTTFLVSYPCEFGFHYLVAGSAVWICFLPFFILTLFGNCWRQCCCCFCDPVVCFATIFDCFKRCLCECGRFSIIDFIWYSMCLFQFIWGCMGGHWLYQTLSSEGKDHELYDYNYEFIPVVITAVVLDLLFAGSELIHKLRILFCLDKEDIAPNPIEMAEIHQNAGDSNPSSMSNEHWAHQYPHNQESIYPRNQESMYPRLEEKYHLDASPTYANPSHPQEPRY